MAKQKRPEFRSEPLAAALAAGDMVAVALALRNGRFVVPLMKPGNPDKPTETGEVWMFRQPETARLALLLFSDAKNKPVALPPYVGLHDGTWLASFLRTYGDDIETVLFDVAGPHSLQASPEELLRVLELEAPAAE
ncbi:SseB protein N-terminal domain-containing protein [Plantibacter flavus]|uniref:Type III secretion system (T3SS) SseB-like protein n=1 Tax=Plantibacter flavus TaxID=150123 RepID=A0A3N2C057_9MICO|nr:SseB family protein [Plantibacter flavus]ROR80830.1 type III secretion system (T3SS) SseB-like protein [Plantibacter flavus]SMG05543.1 SseB protein N-terminal domain-containing protein [Plantibacter flavus]